jgi:putative toxin-antitoxin system antitoxin component (TIGR02293 family)
MASRRERYKAALAKATSVFGDDKRARQWMRDPAFGLDRQVPAALIATAEGAELVDTYLDQIEYGVYV